MPNDAAAALQQLAKDYWEGVLRRNPTLATFYADYPVTGTNWGSGGIQPITR